MQSSTLNVQQNIRKMWKTFSEKPPKECWHSIENRGTTGGGRNVLFCEDKKKDRGFDDPLSCILLSFTFRD